MEIFSVRETCFSSGRHEALYTVNRLFLGLQPVEEERKEFSPEHTTSSFLLPLLCEILSLSNSTHLAC